MTDYDKALATAKKARTIADYELRNHDGGTYRVEYPEVNDALQALHSLLEAIEAQEAETPSAPAAGISSTAVYAMPPESDGHAHLPIQHRDGKPPWCKECGLDAYFKTPVSRLGRKS